MLTAFHLSSLLLGIIFILIISIIFTLQKTKKIEEEKNSLIYIEIEKEKKVAHQLKNVSKKVETLNFTTQNKLLEIKVAVFNLDYTFQELYK